MKSLHNLALASVEAYQNEMVKGTGACGLHRGGGPRLEVLESRVMLAMDPIQFRYDFDTTGWFSDPTLGQTRRDALQRAANDLTSRLNDTLAAIPSPSGTNMWTADFDNPGTGNRQQLANLVVPANTLIVFVGSRDLPGSLDGQASGGFSSSGEQAWNDLILGRGETGAVGPAAARTDVGPWGGAIAFDPAETWNYDPITGNFYNVAQHEIGHLLGITLGFADNTGTYQPTVWENNVTDSNFDGTAAVAAFGGPVPVINDGNGAHFQNQVMSDGRRVTMAREGDGTARGFTTLDFAALDDIGWELRPAAQVPGPTTTPGSAAPFTAITGISGIQVVAKPAGFEVRDTSRVVFNGRLYRGYTDADENVHIEVSPDTTPNFGNSRDTGQQARGNPSLTVNNGKLFIAWTGTNSDQNLNVAQVNVDSNGIFTGLTTGTHEVLGYTSDHAPGIGAHREALVLAHSGQPVDISGDEKLYLDVRAERGSKTSWGPGAFDTGQLTEHPPVLTVFDNGASNEIYLYWIGTDGGDNYARVDFASASFTPPQSFGVGGRSLTVDGDQRAWL